MSLLEESTGKNWQNPNYQLGPSIIGFVVSAIPLLYVFLQTYTSNVQLAILSLFIVVMSLISIVSRPRIDQLYEISPKPPVKKWYWKAVVGFIALYGIYFSGFVLVGRKELSLLSITDPNQSIEFQLGSSIGQEYIFRYLILGAIFVAGTAALRNWIIPAAIALVSSSFIFYGFHFVAILSAIADPVIAGNVLTYIFISGLWLGGTYIVTGSLSLVAFLHVWINTAFLILRVVIPGFLPIAFPGLN
jgi:hypothetical protein